MKLFPSSIAAHYILTGKKEPLRFGIIETMDGKIVRIYSQVPMVEKSTIVFKNGIILPPPPVGSETSRPNFEFCFQEKKYDPTELHIFSQLFTNFQEGKISYRQALLALQQEYPNTGIDRLLNLWLSFFRNDEQELSVESLSNGAYLEVGRKAQFISVSVFDFDQFRLKPESYFEIIDWSK